MSNDTTRAAKDLPDALLVRYFKDGTLDDVSSVKTAKDVVSVTVGKGPNKRIDRWRDLGGGIGYVPDAEDAA